MSDDEIASVAHLSLHQAPPCLACPNRSCTPGACPEGLSEGHPILAKKRASDGLRGRVQKE